MREPEQAERFIVAVLAATDTAAQRRALHNYADAMDSVGGARALCSPAVVDTIMERVDARAATSPELARMLCIALREGVVQPKPAFAAFLQMNADDVPLAPLFAQACRDSEPLVVTHGTQAPKRKKRARTAIDWR